MRAGLVVPDADEPEVDGERALLRPRVPFRSRRAALEAMAAVVRASPPVQRPTSELDYEPEAAGRDAWQTPHETETLGAGDCEDLEMHAARADLDAGERDVQICMTVHAGLPGRQRRRQEHVFGLRNGVVRDRSVEAGMPPIPEHRYAHRVCVPVGDERDDRERGRTMAVQDEEMASGGPDDDDDVETGGPPEIVKDDDYKVHGIAHWRAKAWDKATAYVGQRFPKSRKKYMRVLPALKSAASYFSTLHLQAYDAALNEAKIRKIKDKIWESKKAENIARNAYVKDGGTHADFVLKFEKKYGRPPTDGKAVTAAIKAFVYIATAQEWPNFKKKLQEKLTVSPKNLTEAAMQIAVVAKGFLPGDAFPVPPHCPECTKRRKKVEPKLVEPADIDINVIYNPTTSNTNTNSTATAPGAAATGPNSPAATGSGSAAASGPAAAASGPAAAAVNAVAAAPSPMLQAAAPGAPLLIAAPMAYPVAAPMAAASPFGGFGFGGPFGGFGPPGGGGFGPGALAGAGAGAAAGAALGGGAGSNVSNSGNVTLNVVGDDAGSALDDGSQGYDVGFDPNGGVDPGFDPGGGVDPGAGGGFAGFMQQMEDMGLMSGGPDDDDLLGLGTGGGDDLFDLDTGGDDDDLVASGGDDDELESGGVDVFGIGEETSTGGDDLFDLGTGGDDLFDLGTGGDDDDDDDLVASGGDDDDDDVATGGGLFDDSDHDGALFDVDDDDDDDMTLFDTGGDDDEMESGGDDDDEMESGGDDMLLPLDDDDDDDDCDTGSCGLLY